MKVGIATMEKIENRPENSVGSSRIRGRWLWQNWEDAEEYMVGRHYDVLIFQKAYWREMLLSFDGIKIFDLCDPDWLDPRPVVESIKLCDAAVVSTPALRDYLLKFIKDKPIICIPDRVELKEHSPRGQFVGIAKKIIWYGYSQNSHYIEKTFPFLIDKGLELTVASNAPLNLPLGFEKLKVTNVAYNYDSIHEEIKRHDLVLLPTTGDDLRGKFKSNNKTLTAWALGMPVISEPDDLDRLMDAESRNAEQSEKLAEIRQNWDVKQSVEEYKLLIDLIKENKGAQEIMQIFLDREKNSFHDKPLSPTE